MSDIAPMLPNQPECGSPCSTCEALAHENGRLRDEIASVRKGSATVCAELRAENATLRAFRSYIHRFVDYEKRFEQACSALAKEDKT